ncbi:S8 family serine peptidase [Dokdonella sp.]|uniref:S8 family serine peptidase n=1 Tax=Dokdonella sp. TaxID=2291710 RepID=UPI001B168DAC|nr:S8 family serine peptidase [Dokdonella sp.]MBO9661439.1 S8 family serine peptidase [Dokdonella sp.]
MSKNASSFNAVLAAAIAAAIATAGLAVDTRIAEASAITLTAKQAARGTYIVRFAEAPLATYRGGVAGIAAAPRQSVAGRPAKLDVRAPQSLAYVAHLAERQNAFLSTAGAALKRPLQAKFTYTHALNGMALELTAEEAAQLAKMPGVVSVRKSQARKFATDSGPAWIGAPSVWQGTSTGGLPGTQGEGMVIGVIDTGINFDSPSFAATDADGYRHVNPLGAGTYLGTCAAGGVDEGRCNDKLIGAYTYIGTLPPGSPDVADTATDHAGHGSHTASTAGGSHAQATTADGATVAVSGVAPRANVIMYKVCFAPPPNYGGTCTDDATAAGADQAVADGVDAINFSISGGTDPWGDDTSVAFRNAVEAGIFVATSAGNTANDDPNPARPGTVNHIEPWTITVGASTHDRFYSSVHVEVPGLGTFAGANGAVDEDGAPAYTGPVTGPLVASTDDATACTSFTPPPSTPANFIAVIRAGCTFSDQINNAEEAGAAAVVVYHIRAAAPFVMYMPGTTIPALMISQEDGEALTTYMQSHAGATATADLTAPPTFDHVAAYGDIMGSFSLLGPAGGTTSPWDLLKPEISAPGLSILAAVSGDAGAYGFMQGTSMAAPHVTGSGALLRALHPDWTPMEIKSALMLTARSGVRKYNASAASDPFDRGAGRVDLTRAAASPLVMNETAANMEAADPAAGGDLSALNEPSLSKAACAGTCTFTRVFRNPTATAQSFTAAVQPSNGGALSGTVAPASFTVEPNATQSVTITIDVGAAAVNSWSFGELALTPTSGDPLTLPVAVRASDQAATGPRIELTPTALDSSQGPNETQTRALAVRNTGGAPLTWTVGEQPASVTLSVADRVSKAGAVPALPPAAAGGEEVNLQVDVGLGSHVLGVDSGTPVIFLNRFTPAVADLPFTLDRVDVEFLGGLDGGGDGAVIGEKFDVYVYQDDDEDPSNGATLLGSVKNVAVSVLDALQSVPVPGGIAVSGPGDVLIAVVARDATGGSPATFDDGPGVGRSWLGTDFEATIGDPPDLSAVALQKPEELGIDGFEASNLVLRGHGVRGGAGVCTALADVPWLSAAPASGTTVASGSSEVTVTFDSTGLAAGKYSANVCVGSNDTEHPIVAVPVSMTVTGGGDSCSAADTIFCNGFDGKGGGAFEQPVQDPGFEATEESQGPNPNWTGVDDNDADGTPFWKPNPLARFEVHAGDYGAWGGGWGEASSQHWLQSVTIAGGGPRYLNFWRKVGTLPVGGTATLKVSIDGTEMWTFDMLAAQVDTEWVNVSVDVSSYADDAAHEIRFDYAATGSADGDVYVDDVTVDAAPPTSRRGPPQRPAVHGADAGKTRRH